MYSLARKEDTAASVTPTSLAKLSVATNRTAAPTAIRSGSPVTLSTSYFDENPSFRR